MTPREADKIIKAGKPVMVTNQFEDKPFKVVLVSRDRWNVTTADGGVFDRGDMKLVRCEICNQTGELPDGLFCSIEAELVHDCPGEAIGVDEPAKRFWDEENLKTARTHLDIATDLAQRVADYAKEMELNEPTQREIDALKKATRLLREAGIQLRLAGMPEKKSCVRPTMLDGIIPEVGMRVFAERYGVPGPARICSFVGHMLCEAWVVFENGERVRRRVDRLLKRTAPEEPCTCTYEESDRADCAGCLARMANEPYNANWQRS